jgi:hypothetical protein
LFALSQDQTFATGETLPASFANRAAEESWVVQAASDNALMTVTGGQYAIVKPANFDGSVSNVIYSVGYVPTRADPRRVRVIRSEYDFAPFVPGVALLTGGDLTISGNPTLSGSTGSAHANGDVSISGNPSTSGYVAASGTYTVSGSPTIGDLANTGAGKPAVEVPDITPRDYYDLSEYDLCADGNVRAGPAYGGPEAPNPSLIPCAGTILADANSHEYRGWKKSGDDGSAGAKWNYGGNSTYDGVYYVYLGSVYISGNPGSSGNPWEATIITEASATGAEPHCPHTGGDINVSGNPTLRYHDSAQPLQFMAGRDLDVSGNPGTGDITFEGILAAHEQFDINGNPRVTGAFIAEDVCDTAGSPVDVSRVTGNPEITYNGDLEFPGGDSIRSTLWLEL